MSGWIKGAWKFIKPKKKPVFVKDKSGTITGVTPGSFKKKKKSWKDHVDTSHPSYKRNWPPGE
jgi:hypothetical protein